MTCVSAVYLSVATVQIALIRSSGPICQGAHGGVVIETQPLSAGAAIKYARQQTWTGASQISRPFRGFARHTPFNYKLALFKERIINDAQMIKRLRYIAAKNECGRYRWDCAQVRE